MTTDLKRVLLEPDTDLRKILEAVHADKQPRIIERDGEALAVIVPATGYEDSEVESLLRAKPDIMSFAGVWSDIDADALIEKIYRWRHEAPPSPPVRW